MTGQKEFMASGGGESPKHEELKAVYILSVNMYLYLYKLSIRIYIVGLKVL